MATRLDALFDEQQRTAIGRRLFEEWARKRPGCPRGAAELVDSVSLSDDYVGLYATLWHGRRAVWKSIPSSGKVDPAPPPLSAIGDAWSIDERTVRQQSDHVAVCDACGGAGKLSCATCHSNGNVICPGCHGARKMYGYAANGSRRLLNCRSCRGKGEVDCANCRRGIATCARCGGERRLQRWIEIERWQRTDVGEHPSETARLLGWTGVAARADVEHHGIVVTDVDRARAIVASDVPALPPQWLQLFPRAREGERVVQQRLRVVRIPKLIVSYTVGRTRADAEFTGLALRPPPRTATDAFATRASNLRNLGVLLACVFLVAALFTLARGTFFWSAPSATSLGATFGALAMTWLAAAEATGRRQHTGRWLGAVLAMLFAALVFGWVALPSRDHVAEMISAGELDAAHRELKALGTTNNETLWADLRLARIAQAVDVEVARNELAAIPNHLPQHTAAVAQFDRLLVDTARASARKHQHALGATLLATLSESGRRMTAAIGAVEIVYLPLAEKHIARNEWRAAGDALGNAGASASAAHASIPSRYSSGTLHSPRPRVRDR